ncbi:hypothetical protein NDN08_007358 [Rhodosorus marinus]|uniref:peptidylprolyl isomerase n=1 Tax=Rhodosorus marinus TaxID=101924 RepID=A0AAV8UGC2_9RHOD|nr:hypothetical protein NDN08_007358 [Rhodosorus marinus]
MAGFVEGVGLPGKSASERDVCVCRAEEISRRAVLAAIGISLVRVPDVNAVVEDIPAIRGRQFGKERILYKDFSLTPSGLQYKDVKIGSGNSPNDGDRIVVDWEGYTIGYYGRIFESKNKVKGGAFENDKDYFRWVQGKHTVIPALEEGVRDMKAGGIRQLIIPPEIGYPDWDPRHDKVGPRPTTFSGQRALDFVIQNQGLVDKTLLINVELIRVDRPGDRGFKG